MARAEILKSLSIPGVSLRYESIEADADEVLCLKSPHYLMSYLLNPFNPSLGGLYTWRLPGHHDAVAQQQIGFLPANVPVNVSLAKGSAKVLFCRFDAAFFERLTKDAHWSTSSLVALLGSKKSIINQICELILRQMLNEDSRRDATLRAYLSWLNIELLHECTTTKVDGEEDNNLLLEWRRRKIYRMIEESENMRDIDVEEIAKACRMSAKYLMMQFKVTTGETLPKYIEKVRIRRVKELIENTDVPLRIIAERTGFCSASHMSTTFAKVQGAAPSRFRARSRADRAKH